MEFMKGKWNMERREIFYGVEGEDEREGVFEPEVGNLGDPSSRSTPTLQSLTPDSFPNRSYSNHNILKLSIPLLTE